MCELCHSYPHKPGCPNDEEFYPQRVCFMCYECGEPIYEDEHYIDYDGVQICQSCIDELTTTAVYCGDKEDDSYGENSNP